MSNDSKLIVKKWCRQVLLTCLLLIIALLPIHAFISTWLGTATGQLLIFKSWKEILLMICLPVVVACLWLTPGLLKKLWQRRANQIILLYFLLHILLSFSSEASNAAILASLLLNLRFLAIFLMAQVVFVEHQISDDLQKKLCQGILIVGIFLSVLAIMQVTVMPKDFLVQFGYDKFTTIAPYALVDDNPDALRAFATMRGPNPLGAYLLMPLTLAFYGIIRRRNLRLALSTLALGLPALALTGSRSAWLGLFVSLVILALLIIDKKTRQKWLKIGLLPMILIMLSLSWAVVALPAVRLAILHSSPEDSSLTEGSTANHWQAVRAGMKDIYDNPLGQGPGTAGPASYYNTSGQPKISENYFIQIGQELGYLGLSLFLLVNGLLVAELLKTQRRGLSVMLLASLSGLTLVNLFLHGWTDDPLAMTWWALAGMVLTKNNIEIKERLS